LKGVEIDSLCHVGFVLKNYVNKLMEKEKKQRKSFRSEQGKNEKF